MATIIREFNANNSTFNNAGGNLIQQHTYNVNIAHAEISGPVAGSSHGHHPPPPPSFNDAPVDLLSGHFTGRQTEIAQIADAFGHPRRNIPLRCVLFGDQGVGKSQLTYQWCKSTFERGENTYIVWMSATTVEKVDQGFSKILHLVNHPDRAHSEQTVRLTSARRWLEEVDSGNWLLVLDNVFPDVLEFLREHLPRKNGRGSILFTTRTRDVATTLSNAAGEHQSVVRVPMLSVDDGVELFLGHFRGDENHIPSAKAERIVKSVGCLPLAISHAAAYMTQSGSNVDEMLTLYDGENRIHAISWKNTLTDYEHKSVAATFEHQLEDLERNSPNASRLLKILAYFDPESIPLDMLIEGATSALKSSNPSSTNSPAPIPKKSRSIVQKIKNKVLHRGDSKGKGRVDQATTTPVTPMPDSLLVMVQSPVELRKAIMELQMRCLTAYRDGTHSTLDIHDLIQLVVLEKTRKSTTEHRQCFEWAVELACNAFKQMEDCGSPACWPRCEQLIPHIQSLTSRQDISHEAKARLLDTNSLHGWYLRSRGRYGEAEELLLQVLTDQEHLWGSEDERTLYTMYRLAVVYRERGRYVDAETLVKRVLQLREKLLGPEHVQTLGTMYELAYVYFSQERYAESENLLEQVLKAREKQLGSDHIETLDTKNMLANVYSNQKRHRQAEALFKEVLESMEKTLGADHILIAWPMHNLALAYAAQQQHSDAEGIFLRVLRIREKQLGYNHPDTLMSKHDLAWVYELQGRHDDAEELLVHVLERMEEVLGPSHPDTRRTMHLLAWVYDKLGRSDDAAKVRSLDVPR